MKRHLTIFFILLTTISYAQHDNFQVGGFSRALSDATVTVNDVWSIFNNTAGMAFNDQMSVGIYAENRFGIKELNSGAFSFHLPLQKLGSFGLSYYNFNNSVYFERQKMGFGYALKLTKKLSAGVGFNFLITQIEDVRADRSIFGEIGLLYYPGDKTAIGAHILNPTATSYHQYDDESIPTTMRIGFSHRFSKDLLAVAEIETGSYNKYIFKGGVSYIFNDIFSIQAGFKSLPVSNSFGLQINTKKLQFNLSLQYMQVLDVTPGASANYIFN